MVIIHGAGEFTADEVRAYRQQIYQNVIAAMRVLLDARQKLGFSWQNVKRQEHVESVMRFVSSIKYSSHIFVQIYIVRIIAWY